LFDIPASGTQAHAWVQSFSDEYESFEEFAEVFPEKCVLLVDTYDTLNSGVPNAIKTAKKIEEWGQKLFGIRLDSGDHVHFSRESRRMLDEASLEYVKIVASNELDEHVIEDVLARGAPIDGFGVGTNLVTGSEDGALDGVYKLCESSGKPRLKLSENEAKIINPARKNILRFFRDDKLFGDGIYLESEDPGTIDNFYNAADENNIFDREGLEAKVLLKKIMAGDEVVLPQQSTQEIAERVQEKMALLPGKYKVLSNAPVYPVGVSKKMLTLRKQLIDLTKAKYNRSQ
jgi:nicotinate phosphoribosyltransferase